MSLKVWYVINGYDALWFTHLVCALATSFRCYTSYTSTGSSIPAAVGFASTEAPSTSGKGAMIWKMSEQSRCGVWDMGAGERCQIHLEANYRERRIRERRIKLFLEGTELAFGFLLTTVRLMTWDLSNPSPHRSSFYGGPQHPAPGILEIPRAKHGLVVRVSSWPSSEWPGLMCLCHEEWKRLQVGKV